MDLQRCIFAWRFPNKISTHVLFLLCDVHVPKILLLMQIMKPLLKQYFHLGISEKLMQQNSSFIANVKAISKSL
jgi:sensor histidine kinase regulating citrate/malate metabolism